MPDAPPSDPAQPASNPDPTQPPAKRRTWTIVAAFAVIALILWSWLGRGSHGSDTSINLVTTDRDDLACASEQTIGGHYRCEFRAPGVPWPNPSAPADRLAPYYTMDQQLYVIPALFEQSALSARYTAEQPKNLPRDQRPRFAAACQLKVIDHLKNFQTRWLKTGEWNHQDDAPVAVPSDCHIP